MLCITRKAEDSFVIGENIEVKILEVRGDKVRIGITAPPEVTILRTEILERYSTKDDDEIEKSK